MADEITLEDIQRKQQQILDEALKLADEKNGEKVMKKSKELSAMGKELEEMARAFEVQEKAKAPEQRFGFVAVKLTPGQRERINAETGIDMEEVHITSEGPFMSQFMPNAEPEYIEQIALQQAQQKAAQEAALKESHAMAEKHMQAISKEKNPDLRKLLNNAAEDPNFLGGLLKKKE